MTAARPLPRGLRGYAALLSRKPSFRSLWIGAVISQMGDWFNTVALLGLLVELTNNPASASFALITQTLPSALAGLFISGVVADRFDRKKIMITADLVRAAIALSYLLVHSAEMVWLAYAATVGLSLGSSFFYPASSAAIPNLVQPEELPTANALGQSTFASMLFVGSFIGGAIAQAFGRDVAFILNSLSFLLSAFFIWRAKGNFNAAGSKQIVAGSNALRILADGFRYLKQSIVARTYVGVKLVWPLTFGAIGLFSVYSLQIYGTGDAGTSWLYAARGLGAFLGPFLVGSIVPLTQTGTLRKIIKIGLLVSVTGYAVFAVSTTVIQGVAGVFVAHFGGAWVWTFSTVILQSTTPDQYRGRVMALDSVTFSVVYSIATLIAGAVAAAISPQAGALTAVGMGAIGAVTWIIASWKS
jgi:MFS family permease